MVAFFNTINIISMYIYKEKGSSLKHLNKLKE